MQCKVIKSKSIIELLTTPRKSSCQASKLKLLSRYVQIRNMHKITYSYPDKYCDLKNSIFLKNRIFCKTFLANYISLPFQFVVSKLRLF